VDAKTKQKAAYFILALALFGLVAGSDLRHAGVTRLAIYYTGAAIFVFWIGGDPIGALRPASMRPLCIFLGGIVMIALFIMMLFVKETWHRAPRRQGLSQEYQIPVGKQMPFLPCEVQY
jgi:hypothetical protein